MKGHKERGPKRFCYTYQDLAVLFDMKPEAVRQAASRGRFDPSSLQSIVSFCARLSAERNGR